MVVVLVVMSTGSGHSEMRASPFPDIGFRHKVGIGVHVMAIF
jgi:hypothetical protein